jgi:hypothetical protein
MTGGTTMLAVNRDPWWLLANLIGMGLFFYQMATGWAAPELRAETVFDGSANDMIGWGIATLAIPAMFALVNMAWLIQAVVGAIRAGQWMSILVVLGMAWAWASLIMFDYGHRGTPLFGDAGA